VAVGSEESSQLDRTTGSSSVSINVSLSLPLSHPQTYKTLKKNAVRHGHSYIHLHTYVPHIVVLIGTPSTFFDMNAKLSVFGHPGSKYGEFQIGVWREGL
jgi:hypothetical protein